MMKCDELVLVGSDDQEHSLKDYLGKRLVLFFYPKDSTPG